MIKAECHTATLSVREPDRRCELGAPQPDEAYPPGEAARDERDRGIDLDQVMLHWVALIDGKW